MSTMKKDFNLNIILMYVIAPVLLMISCHKQDNGVPPPKTDSSFSLLGVIEKYYKVTNTKVDGKFMFESNLCNNDPSLTNISLAGGIFYDKNGNLQTGGGQISIGDNKWMPNAQGTYGFDKVLPQQGLFGTNVTFTLKPPSAQSNNQSRSSGASASTLTTTLYSPLAISITNVPPQTSLTLVPYQNTLLQWNTDPKDSNGVIVIAEFLPGRYVNKTTLSQGYTYLMEKSMLVPDNGSTSIPWSFFSMFPAGGHVILWVARGNYSIAANGTYNYQVGGYTAAAVWDVKVPASPALVSGSSYISAPYQVKFTNNSTGLIYTMILNPSSSGSIQIPVGTYSVGFFPNSGVTINTTFYVNGLSASGYGTTFYNVNMPTGTSSYVRIGIP